MDGPGKECACATLQVYPTHLENPSRLVLVALINVFAYVFSNVSVSAWRLHTITVLLLPNPLYVP
jgi:hypothetical protein